MLGSPILLAVTVVVAPVETVCPIEVIGSLDDLCFYRAEYCDGQQQECLGIGECGIPLEPCPDCSVPIGVLHEMPRSLPTSLPIPECADPFMANTSLSFRGIYLGGNVAGRARAARQGEDPAAVQRAGTLHVKSKNYRCSFDRVARVGSQFYRVFILAHRTNPAKNIHVGFELRESPHDVKTAAPGILRRQHKTDKQIWVDFGAESHFFHVVDRIRQSASRPSRIVAIK